MKTCIGLPYVSTHRRDKHRTILRPRRTGRQFFVTNPLIANPSARPVRARSIAGDDEYNGPDTSDQMQEQYSSAGSAGIIVYGDGRNPSTILGEKNKSGWLPKRSSGGRPAKYSQRVPRSTPPSSLAATILLIHATTRIVMFWAGLRGWPTPAPPNDPTH